MLADAASAIRKNYAELVKAGEIEAARDLAREARRADRLGEMPLLFLVQCLIMNGAVPQALAEINEAEAATAAELARIGTILFEKGHVRESVEILERAKASDPSLTMPRESLTRALYASGEKAAAKIELDDFKSLCPRTSEGLSRIFKLYQDLQMNDFLEDAAKQVLAIDPNHIDIRRSLIDFHFSRGNRDKARGELKYFCECRTLDARALLLGARSYLRFTALAQREIDQLQITRDPANLRRLEAAKIYMRSGRQPDLDAAAELARRAIETSVKPNFAAKVALVEALGPSKTKVWLKAELEGIRALATTVGHYTDIAELCAKLSFSDEALKAAKEAIKLAHSEARTPSALIRLANVLIVIKSISEAEVLLKSIRPETLSSINLLKQFHEACFKTTYHEGALRSADLILEMEPYTERYVIRRTALAITTRPMPSAPPPRQRGFFARLLRGSKPY